MQSPNWLAASSMIDASVGSYATKSYANLSRLAVQNFSVPVDLRFSSKTRFDQVSDNATAKLSNQKANFPLSFSNDSRDERNIENEINREWCYRIIDSFNKTTVISIHNASGAEKTWTCWLCNSTAGRIQLITSRYAWLIASSSYTSTPAGADRNLCRCLIKS